MRTLVLLILLATSSSAHAENWTCTAPNMISGSYDGGSMAYIHLTGFPDGGTYSVQKSGNNKVSGTTKNGTKFTCVKR